MLRLLHTADVHLGARHADLGEAAVAQRERQFAAFVRTIDLALAEGVDVVLVAGDLFDSNVQPRRSVERVAAELRRLVAGRIRTVITPGTHDVYDRASVYRAHDLPAMAAPRDEGMVTVLTPEQPSAFLRDVRRRGRRPALPHETRAVRAAARAGDRRAPAGPLEGRPVPCRPGHPGADRR
jgi:DNA repair exonuclease SbcCD nuclease subunit